MHRIVLNTIVIDVPEQAHERTRDFWAAALGASARRGTKYPEYHVLEHAAALGTVMVQDVGTAPARVHLDIESSDVEAEVTRLVGAGAEVVERQETWVVLRDPAGLLFCVVPGEGEQFEAQAKDVG